MPGSGRRFDNDAAVLLAPLDEAPRVEPPARPPGWSEVPWRTIIATIGLVLLTLAGLVVLYLASYVVVLIVVAGFFAVVLNGPVHWIERYTHLRRGAAIALVITVVVALLVGLIALLVLPLRAQLINVVTDLPGTIRQAGDGEGPLGRTVSRLQLQGVVRENQDALIERAESLEASVPSLAAEVLGAAVALVTVVVMTCLMLSQSRRLASMGARMVPARHREWATLVAHDAGRAISGYMIGNLIISVCAGVTAFLALVVLGVPNPVAIALFVAFVDLIPLIGATLGAVVAVVAALTVSPSVGIITLVFFVLYQQFENSVLQVVIMARTVQVNPLVVLVSVLLGAELFGLVGALLAIPVAGAGLVVAKEVWRQRPGAATEELLVATSSGAIRRVTVATRLVHRARSARQVGDRPRRPREAVADGEPIDR